MTEALPVGVVLTIAASGSEGSGNSVITKLDGMHKISLRTTVLRPRFAILNPELTFTLPAYQIACGVITEPPPTASTPSTCSLRHISMPS